MQTFDITPDPQVLIALTHTPMAPLDALCELIDNGIDSFHSAELAGTRIDHPLVVVELPRRTDLDEGRGVVRVRDNGPGMSSGDAEKAIKAGFSGKRDPYATLGLFGMGFNISTGKLGRVTRFTTARAGDEKAIQVVIDLEKLQRTSSYEVPVDLVEKPAGFDHGTMVEVTGWWPEGNPNSAFVRRLPQYGLPKVREEIGRRYASILREGKLRIILNDEPCTPYEHCVWADHRYVDRRTVGKVPAVFRFDEVLSIKQICTECSSVVPDDAQTCPACSSASRRTLEERVRGWLGIQRYDHKAQYGIDLIRNGRAIRVGEKSAFFEFVDEFKNTITDYPIDGIFGRIIGEVHLDHVRVDFLKQDFQRSSDEWQRAMAYLRGESSLQPKQPNADKNNSPMFKLYQGYRRVRTPGRADMYMGYWDDAAGKPARISRDVEAEFIAKFKKGLPGFYDDAEWWKKVEEADTPPVAELVECPNCKSQNLAGHDVCSVCEGILISKACKNEACEHEIPASAVVCPHCGTGQVPEIKGPWKCDVCGAKNEPDEVVCAACQAPVGSSDPLAKDSLVGRSNQADHLSPSGVSIVLSDGSHSAPLNIRTYLTDAPLQPFGSNELLPLVSFKDEVLEFFVDPNHAVFKNLQIRPEEMIAAEVALFIYDSNRRLSGHSATHSLTAIQSQLLLKNWGEQLSDGAEKVRADATSLLSAIRDRLPDLLGAAAPELFDDLTEDQQRSLVNNVLNAGEDISRLAQLKESGDYLRYISDDTVVSVVRSMPEKFFDGKFWSDSYATIEGLPDEIIEDARRLTKGSYLNCLEDLVAFLGRQQPEAVLVRRTRASVDLLTTKLAAPVE